MWALSTFIGYSEYQYQYQYSTDSSPLQNVVIVQGVWKSFQPEYKPGKLLQDLNPF